jgi:serine/arginine repetitive matrix protein 2
MPPPLGGIPPSRSTTPTYGAFLSAPPPPNGKDGNGGGSIALRAMRSVRSLAKMKSWSQLKGDGSAAAGPSDAAATNEEEAKSLKSTKSKSKENKSKTKAKDKASKKASGNAAADGKRAAKSSTSSSFEIGKPSPVASPAVQKPTKKKSILGLGSIGLGLPSTLRLGREARSASTSAMEIFGSTGHAAGGSASIMEARAAAETNRLSAGSLPPQDPNRLSAESAYSYYSYAKDRPRSASQQSTTSLLRPDSVISSGSSGENANAAGKNNRISKASTSGSSVRSSSGLSIRWDDERLVKIEGSDQAGPRIERRSSASSGSVLGLGGLLRRGASARSGLSTSTTESQAQRMVDEMNVDSDSRAGSRRTSRHSAEGRKRTALGDIFPEVVAARSASGSPGSASPAPSNTASSSSSCSSYGHAMDFDRPILTVEEATSDGHSVFSHSRQSSRSHAVYRDTRDTMHYMREVHAGREEIVIQPIMETEESPVARPRARPMSEQLLKNSSVPAGRRRPRGIHEEDDEGGLYLVCSYKELPADYCFL